MAKIVLLERKEIIVRHKKEIEVPEGKLILLLVNSNIDDGGKMQSGTLGTLKRVIENPELAQKTRSKRGGQGVLLENIYRLLPAMDLWGVKIPMFRQYPRGCYKEASIRELYVGVDEITNKLRSAEGFAPHADLIEKMKSPHA